jgi:hypothetical protein
MNQREFLILDDVSEAIARLTPLGQETVWEPAQTVRDAVIHFAARRNWLVMPHSGFVTWAMGVVGKSKGPWFAPDPLVPPKKHIWPVRVTRAGLGSSAIQQLDLSDICAPVGMRLKHTRSW